jgi:lysophospholipase L1-like esterase
VITGVLSNAARPFVTEVQTRASRRAGVVVAVGDSITDGDQRKANLTELGIDEDARYPDFLARRLRSHRRRLSVINEGIGGNRILRDAFSPGAGPSLLRRLHVDVLARRNVTDVILMAGTNDLGFDPAVTADDVIRGLRRAVQRLNRLNVLVGTIPPRSDGLAPPNTNARRNAINHWIRTSGIGDGVVDFDRALRDPSNRSRLAPRYDAGDGLHPSSAGYRRMARTVRLSRLEGPRCGRRRPVARVRVQDAAPIP